MWNPVKQKVHYVHTKEIQKKYGFESKLMYQYYLFKCDKYTNVRC